MRDPQRIDTILELVRQVWVEQPDLRLGQLIFNAARMRDPELKDIYNIEDAVLQKGLRRYLERIKGSGNGE